MDPGNARLIRYGEPALGARSSPTSSTELLDQVPQQILPSEEQGPIIGSVGVVDLDAQIAEGCLQELEQLTMFLIIERQGQHRVRSYSGRHRKFLRVTCRGSLTRPESSMRRLS